MAVQFLQCLYVRFDFDAAQEKLQACQEVLENDLFLYQHTETFMKEARQLIFETYCRIHQKIDINMLAQKLGTYVDRGAVKRKLYSEMTMGVTAVELQEEPVL